MLDADIYYRAIVRDALKTDGWTITHDSYLLKFGDEEFDRESVSDSPMGAEKGSRHIAVVVKSFLGRSPIAELERALGQFLLQRHLMKQTEPARNLFLAVPEEAYYSLFEDPLGRNLTASEKLKLIVFDPAQGRVIKWIE